MDKNIFVSFIIPAYNAHNHIGRCLEAIKAIDHPRDRFEIVIADNGSSDDTLEIAGRFTDKIIIDAATSVGRLRNLGAARSAGDLFVFIDSDCIIRPDWLKKATAYFKDDAIGAVGARTYVLTSEAGWIEDAWGAYRDKDRGVKEARWVISAAMAVRKESFLAIGGFDEALVSCEDVEFGYRMNKRYKVISDEGLAPLHLKKSPTLAAFFQAEAWRGRDSFKVGLKYLGEKGEIRSLLVLSYYFLLFALFVPVTMLSLVTKNAWYFSGVVLAMIIPLGIISSEVALRKKKISYLWKFLVLFGIYFSARIWGIVTRCKK